MTNPDVLQPQPLASRRGSRDLPPTRCDPPLSFPRVCQAQPAQTIYLRRESPTRHPNQIPSMQNAADIAPPWRRGKQGPAGRGLMQSRLIKTKNLLESPIKKSSIKLIWRASESATFIAEPTGWAGPCPSSRLSDSRVEFSSSHPVTCERSADPKVLDQMLIGAPRSIPRLMLLTDLTLNYL